MTTKTIVLYVLNSGIVLDRAAFIGASAAVMQEELQTLRTFPGKPLKVIPSAAQFFTSDNLLALLRANDNDYKLIAEHTGVTITEEQAAAIIEAERTQAAIREAMTPPYNFSPLPEGWSLLTMLNIGKTRVSRKQAFNDYSKGYPISLNQCKRLWEVASKFWANQSHINYIYDVRADGYEKRAEVRTSYIEIGCQKVARYELEQLAVYQGWDFPAPQAA